MFRRVACNLLKTRVVRPLVPLSGGGLRFSPVSKPYVRYQSNVQLPKQELMLAFTCNKCSTRSSHTISKQAYTGGTVLVQCPGCQNRHLIADHLKIFKDNKFTIEQLMEVSKSTNDLVFDEIPEKLKGVLGYYAPDAPKEYQGDEINETDEVKKLK